MMRAWVAMALLMMSPLAVSAEMTAAERQAAGKKLFEATCVYCHNARGFATERLKLRVGDERAVLTDRKDLQRDFIRHVVRNGLLSMPAFTPTDLSDARIQLVADYLMRNNEKERASK